MTDAERQLHEALNVAIRRWGGHWVPACDGPDCPVCAVIATAFMARAEAADAKLQALQQAVRALEQAMRDYEHAPTLQPLGRSQQISEWIKELATLTQPGAASRKEQDITCRPLHKIER